AGSANINGTANRIIKFTAATTGGNSLIWDNGTNVGIGTSSPQYPFDVRSTNSSRTINSFNTNANGDGLWGQNTAAANTLSGAGVVGITNQGAAALATDIWGENSHTSGVGVAGIGNGQ